MSGTHNILVISDLHLGEDLTAVSSPEMTRDLRRAEGQLIEFLRKYTRRRADGKPWRLVINGDMVDFLAICVFPDDGPDDRPNAVSKARDAAETEYGLGRRREAALPRVAAVLEHHAGFFRALARFVAAGNAVEIISGNHDTELHWPEVRDALSQGVVHAWLDTPESERTGAASADEIRGRIRFHEWFYYEPGVVWIEHGHRYDECCSYQYNLQPVDDDGETIVTNVDTAAMQHLVNPFAEASPHGSEQWSTLGFLRLGLSEGPGLAWRFARGYYRFATSLLSQWRKIRVSRSRHQRRKAHKRALAELGQTSPLCESDLRSLDALQRRPVITNLRRLMQVLMLDKVLVWAAALLAIVASVMAFPFWAWLPLGVASVVGADRMAAWLQRGRMIDPSLPLAIVPRRILERVDARYVIFGHTHLPVARKVAVAGQEERGPDAEHWYFNTGTWVPSGKQGLLGSFTHALIRILPDGRVRGRLCQWRDGASRVFDPDEVLGTSHTISPFRPPVPPMTITPEASERPAPTLAPEVVASMVSRSDMASVPNQAPTHAG